MAEKFDTVKGQVASVEWAVLDNDQHPPEYEAFYCKLDLRVRVKLKAIMTHIADNGHKHLPKQMFRHEDGPIWTFIAKDSQGRMIRLPCFQRNNRWIITHGFYKPNQRFWPQEQFDRAYAIKNEVEQREDRLSKRS